MGEQGRRPEDFQLDSGWTVGEDEGGSTETPRAIEDMTEEEVSAALIEATERDEEIEAAIVALRVGLKKEGKAQAEVDALVDQSPLLRQRTVNRQRTLALNRRWTDLSGEKKK